MPTSPLRLHAFAVEGYRCFRDRERLELRPLTLVYGRNNAGKSALLRALVILGRSVAPGAPSAWDVGDEDGPGQGASFKSLPWRPRPTKRFTLALEWEPGGIIDELVLEQDAPTDPVVIRSVHPDSRRQALRWARIPSNERSTSYRRTDQVEEELQFDGLVPVRPPHPALEALAARLCSLRGQIQWLHGGRSRAPRDFRLSGAIPHSLEPDGSDAPQKLVMETTTLLPGVNAFYKSIGRELRHSLLRPDAATLLLDAPGREAWAVELADAGEGMAKVLPVLVAVESAATGRGPAIAVIEDPDVHLHDDAERALTEHLCDRARGNRPILVVETHSRTMLLAVQNQVRLGLPADRVGIVWAQLQADGHSRLVPVELDRHGQPTSHELRTAFQEDARLAAELAGLPVPRS